MEAKAGSVPSSVAAPVSIPPPLDALKRFATEVKSEAYGARFYELNLRRVDEFITKVEVDDKEAKSGVRELLEKRVEDRRRKVGGVEYPDKKEYHRSLSALQRLPEGSAVLGPRSRFGEGDGSFFDRFVANTEDSLETVLSKSSPLRGAIIAPTTGFRRHLAAVRQGQDKPPEMTSRVIPYAERRKERLDKEAADKERLAAEEIGPADQTLDPEEARSPPSPSPARSAPAPLGWDEGAPQPFLSLPPLTDQETETYFGSAARDAFFRFYKQLSRQHMTMAPSNTLTDLLYEPGPPVTPATAASVAALRAADRIRKRRAVLASELLAEDDERWNEKQNGQKQKQKQTQKAQEQWERRGEAGAGLEEGSSGTFTTGLENDDNDNNDGNKAEKGEGEGEGEELLDSAALARLEREMIIKQRAEAHALQLRHLLAPEEADGPPGGFRPPSARTRFIISCLDNDVGPRPGLIIRKDTTAVLDVQAQLMGDKIAVLLADALAALPMLQELNVCENNLTDPGLTALVLAMAHCPLLVRVNISCNKIDMEASGALSHYLASATCQIRSLVMQQSDVDDVEAANFVQAVGVQNTMELLDMSRNLLGSHERLAMVNSSVVTGAAALGSLLSTPSCSLKTLLLSWNQIQRSGATLALSLRANSSLTHLDLAYNGLGNEGAEAFGVALGYNSSLVRLELAQNRISGRGAFCVLSGAKACKTLRHLDLSGNPIGELGAACVASLGLSLGKGECDVNIQGCSLKFRDASAWFNPSRPDGSYSLDLSDRYQRCVARELLCIVAEREEFGFSAFSVREAGDGAALGAGAGAGAALAAHDLEFSVRRVTKVTRRPPEPVPEPDGKPEDAAGRETPRAGKEKGKGKGEGEGASRAGSRKGGTRSSRTSSKGARVVGADDGVEGEGVVEMQSAVQELEQGSQEGKTELTAETGTASAESEGVGEGVEAGLEGSPVKETKSNESEGQEDDQARGEEQEEEQEEDEVEEEEAAEVEKAPQTEEQKLLAIAQGIDAATELFRQFDKDGSGSLDHRELTLLLVQLGLGSGQEVVSKLLAAYDVDGAGTIELDEFRHFLQQAHLQAQRSQAFTEETRFLVEAENAANPQAAPYQLPERGLLTCVVSAGQGGGGDFVQTVPAESLDALLDGLANVSDSATMLETALTSLRLALPEGLKLYRALLGAGTGGALNALELLLPRMATPSDALGLLSAVPLRLEDTFRLKASLGWNLFRVCCGQYCGFFPLQLGDDRDRQAFFRLLETSRHCAAQRSKRGLGDVSQQGDYSCFRNAVFNGVPVSLDEGWCDSPPASGLLSLDFAYAASVGEGGAGGERTPLSFSRFMGVLSALGLTLPPLPDTDTELTGMVFKPVFGDPRGPGAALLAASRGVDQETGLPLMQPTPPTSGSGNNPAPSQALLLRIKAEAEAQAAARAKVQSQAQAQAQSLIVKRCGVLHEQLVDRCHSTRAFSARPWQMFPSALTSLAVGAGLAELYDTVKSVGGVRAETAGGAGGLAAASGMVCLLDREERVMSLFPVHSPGSGLEGTGAGAGAGAAAVGLEQQAAHAISLRRALSAAASTKPPQPPAHLVALLGEGISSSAHITHSAESAHSGKADERVLGLRLLSFVVDALRGRCVTSAQLALLVQLLPAGAQPLVLPLPAVSATSPPSAMTGAAIASDSCAGGNPSSLPAQAQTQDQTATTGEGQPSETETETEQALPPTPSQLWNRQVAKLRADMSGTTGAPGGGPGAGAGAGATATAALPATATGAAAASSKSRAELAAGFASLRVELVLALFPSLSDPLHLDVVLEGLGAKEVSMLLIRLGWLFLWSPLRPEGYYLLDLSRREERQVVRALVLLSYLEPGGSWRQAAYLESWGSERPETQWSMPLSWFNEATLPQKGTLAVRYGSDHRESGSAEGATETLLQPSLGARAAISGCVFAQPPVEQAKLFPKASLANSDALIENAGIKLSFDSLRQLEMRNAGKPPKSQGKGASRGGKR